MDSGPVFRVRRAVERHIRAQGKERLVGVPPLVLDCLGVGPGDAVTWRVVSLPSGESFITLGATRRDVAPLVCLPE